MNKFSDAILAYCKECKDEVITFPRCEIEDVASWSKQIKVGIYLICEECGDVVAYDFRHIFF